MKNKLITPRGFTLIELLCVIAILALLGAISAPIILRQLNSAKKIEAATLAQHLAQSCEFWKEDTYSYPYAQGGNTPPENDKSYITGGNSNTSKVLSTLMAHDNSINKSGTNYLVDFPSADSNGEGGLLQASSNGTKNSGGNNSGNNAIYNALTDPWGNPYVLLFDHNDDGIIQADNQSFLDSYQNQTWNSTNMVIISAGSNGLFDKKDDIVITR